MDVGGNPEARYALDVAPTGMTIDANTGQIECCPSEVGVFEVTVVAESTEGMHSQSYIISVSPYEEVVDNESQSFTAHGVWSSSTSVPGYYGTDYLWTFWGDGAASAEWVFDAPTEGHYQVLA